MSISNTKTYKAKNWYLLLCFVPAINILYLIIDFIVADASLFRVFILCFMLIVSIVPLYYPIKYFSIDTIVIDTESVFINEVWLLKKYKKFDIKNVQLGASKKAIKVWDDEKKAMIYKHHFSKEDWESIYSEFKSISNSKK